MSAPTSSASASSAAAEPSEARTPRKRPWVALAVLAAYVLAVAVGGVYSDCIRPLPDPTKPVAGWQRWVTPVEQNAFMRMPVITGVLTGMGVSADGQVIVLVGAEDFLLSSPDSGLTWIRGTVSSSEEPVTPKPTGAFHFGLGLTGTAYAEAPDKSDQGAAAAPPYEAKGGETKTPESKAESKPAASTRKSSRANAARSLDLPLPELVPDTQSESDKINAKLQREQANVPATPPPESKRKLLAISIVDNNTYVAVGERGLIVRSTDAGRSWSIRASQAQNTLRAIACARKTCVAAGSNGALVRSGDAGNTWHAAVLDSDVRVNAIIAVRSDRFCAVGSRRALLCFDGNAKLIDSIELESSASAQDFEAFDIAFARDGNSGAITTSGGRSLFTRDAGRSWQEAPAAPESPRQIAFGATGRALAVAHNPLSVLVTDDLGEHWSARGSAVERVPPLHSGGSDPQLVSTERGEVFLLGDDNALFKRSSDGSWSQLAFGSDFSDMEVLPTRQGLIVGSHGSVFATRDAGDTWELRDSRADAELYNVGFADRQQAMIVGETFARSSWGEGTVLRSSDAGASWSQVALASLPQAPGALRYADARHIFQSGYTVRESIDGGGSWTERDDLRGTIDMAFADAQRGLRTTYPPPGNSGATYSTIDSGRTWTKLDPVEVVWIKHNGRTRYALFAADSGQPVSIPGSLPLHANALAKLRGIHQLAMSDAGVGIAIPHTRDVLLRTPDHGETWASIANPTNVPLEAVRFAGNDRVVVLAQGRVAVSDNAGETFRLVEYRRYPSPWLWLSSLLLVAGVLVYARSSINAPAAELGPPSIADAAASDRPIQWWDPDHAGLRDIALGLSRFLRNRKTDPPLTIAVTGEWGTGKSSLMNLLRHDLERYGYKPVWFNAWHHQSGENLLGSLLANIHAQGVPPFFSLAGLDFRLSLTATRSRRLWLQACLILLVFAVVGFSYPVLKDKWFSFWSTLSKTGEGDLANLKAATGVFGFALAVLWQLAGVLRMVSAFGLQPGKLIAAVASTSEDESTRSQAGARYRFAREFEDFTHALEPRPLVVFIDDLDRCRAPNVVETLEAVNFLVSSGRCMVVLGMARHWVETCVGLAFKELADAHVEAAQLPAATGSGEQLLFARHYLEKLINIEIRVPQLSDAAQSAILQGSEPSAPHHDVRYAIGTGLLRVGRWSALALALGAIAWLGYAIAQSLTGTPAAPVAEASLAEPTSARVAPESTPAEAVAPTTALDNTQVTAVVARLEPSREHASSVWYWSGGALAALGMLALVTLALFARREARTDDSPAFREALRIWQPFILLGGTSPRSLKRFINQLRYLAMRSRLSPDTTTAYERMIKRIRGFFGRDTPEVPSLVPPQNPQRLTEELLVALAALHRCNETWLHALLIAGDHGELNDFLVRELSGRLQDAEERSAVIARLVDALHSFNSMFPSSALFSNAALDQARAHAFFALMALGDVPSAPAKTGAHPAPPRVTTAVSNQLF